MIKDSLGTSEHRLAILVSGGPDHTGGKLLAVPTIADGTGLAQAEATATALDDWGVSDNVTGPVDTKFQDLKRRWPQLDTSEMRFLFIEDSWLQELRDAIIEQLQAMLARPAYLQPQTVVLSLASDAVGEGERQALAEALLSQPESADPEDAALCLESHTDLVTDASWQLFQLLKLDPRSWLRQPACACEDDSGYTKVQNIRA
ncbi:hypothetical protein FJT64_007211 [Amphibalanus amphitrite]|uniref:Uncharacterized protein n=1 Tax=Amphibalanus amphitrite TaxID=1232801 RepID=A0A6A4VL20_AMPAM|nr:hypothetical protein FJT64_007211 [Amphibalanus amphitrite]